MTMPSGAATTANRTRRVSSDTKTPALHAARDGPASTSDFHDLGLFGLDQVVDLVDVIVVDSLQILLGMLDVVLGHTLQFLESLAGVRPRMPNGDLPLLGELVNDFDKLFTPLLIHRGQWHADDGSLCRWVEAEIRFPNRLLDDLRLRFVEGRDDEYPRLRRRHRRDLVEGHRRAVHVDVHRVEHVRRRLARTNGGKLAARAFDAFVHRAAHVLDDLLNGHHRTKVPTRSPRTAATNAPGRWMLSTISGR